MSFQARFPGTCARCDDPIEAGELIEPVNPYGRHVTDYRHVACPEVAPDKPTKFQGTTLEDMGF